MHGTMARTRWPSFRSMCLLLLFGVTPAALAADDDFVVEEARTQLSGDIYRLSASFSLGFTPPVLEALENGVPLTIVMDIELLRPRAWRWDETVASLHQRYILSYHALSDQYLILNRNSGARTSYPTLAMTLAALEHLPDLPVIDSQLLESQVDYTVRLRVRLDLTALPAPLWGTAFTTRTWWLGSDWLEFPLEQTDAR